MRLIFFSLSITLPLWGSIVGNPSSPALFQSGLISSVKTQNISFRGGYVADYVYHMRFDDEIIHEDSASEKITMTNYSTLMSANFYKRVDIYALLGTMQLCIKDTMEFRRKFMWAVGSKAILYEKGGFCLGADLKYLASEQKALFLLIDDFPATLLTDFMLEYMEVQGSLALTYKWSYFAPYIGGVYLYAKAEPNPNIGFFSITAWDMEGEFPAVNIVNRKKWGFVAGVTIFSKKAATINIEGHAIDQYSVNVQGEIAF